MQSVGWYVGSADGTVLVCLCLTGVHNVQIAGQYLFSLLTSFLEIENTVVTLQQILFQFSDTVIPFKTIYY